MAALDKMSAEYKSTFILYTNLLNSIGLAPFDESKGIFTWNNARSIAFCSTFFPFSIITFSLLANVGTHDFLEVAQGVPILVMFITDYFKVAVLYRKRSTLRSLFVEIGELWPTEAERSPEQTQIITTLVRRNNKWTFLFFSFAVANMVAYETIPFMTSVYSATSGSGPYVVPFQLPDFWPLDYFPVYLISYVYELISTVPSQMCLYIPTDILIVSLCCNLSVLFTVLQSDLRNIIRRDGERADRRLYYTDEESFENIKRVVNTHQQLFRLSRQVSNVFGILLFIHMISSSIIICFFGFLAIVYGSIADKALYIMTVFNVTLMIFILAVAGQLLYDASSNVAEAAYQSLWYESDIRVRRTIYFIIVRSQKPACFSALGFSDMTLRTFTKILSSAWTYFNLLIQVFEEI